MIHYYDTDSIEIVPGMEPQVAVLKYLGIQEEPADVKSGDRRKNGLLSRILKR